MQTGAQEAERGGTRTSSCLQNRGKLVFMGTTAGMGMKITRNCMGFPPTGVFSSA